MAGASTDTLNPTATTTNELLQEITSISEELNQVREGVGAVERCSKCWYPATDHTNGTIKGCKRRIKMPGDQFANSLIVQRDNLLNVLDYVQTATAREEEARFLHENLERSKSELEAAKLKIRQMLVTRELQLQLIKNLNDAYKLYTEGGQIEDLRRIFHEVDELLQKVTVSDDDDEEDDDDDEEGEWDHSAGGTATTTDTPSATASEPTPASSASRGAATTTTTTIKTRISTTTAPPTPPRPSTLPSSSAGAIPRSGSAHFYIPGLAPPTITAPGVPPYPPGGSTTTTGPGVPPPIPPGGTTTITAPGVPPPYPPGGSTIIAAPGAPPPFPPGGSTTLPFVPLPPVPPLPRGEYPGFQEKHVPLIHRTDGQVCGGVPDSDKVLRAGKILKAEFCESDSPLKYLEKRRLFVNEIRCYFSDLDIYTLLSIFALKGSAYYKIYAPLFDLQCHFTSFLHFLKEFELRIFPNLQSIALATLHTRRQKPDETVRQYFNEFADLLSIVDRDQDDYINEFKGQPNCGNSEQPVLQPRGTQSKKDS